MPINLSKGQKVDLTKGNPGLTKIMVGLGWDVNAFDSGSAFDLDAAAFLLGASGKCPTERDFIFYGNLKHSTGAVEHMGDNLTGEGDGDDEQIMVDLAKVPANIERIAFTCTIYDAENRRQNFGQVSNAFIRIVDQSTGTELIRYDLAEDFSIETAIVVGELYRHNGEWKFNAIGSGFQGCQTKGNPGLTKVVVGLGWDVNSFDTGGDFDLDAAAFLLGESGKVTSSGDFVFYGNLKHSSGAVEHLGDNLTGEGAGDDEQIRIDLTKVPDNIQRIAFTVTIYEAESRRQNFGMVNNAFIRIFDEANGQEMLRYDLGEDFSIETAAVFGEVYKNNGEWKFNAIGSGYQGGLAALCANYGVDVE